MDNLLTKCKDIIINNDIEKFKQLIAYEGLIINKEDLNNIFHDCIIENKLSMITYLVERGLNFRENDDLALVMSVQYGYWNITKYLIEQGANPATQNNACLMISYYHNDLEGMKYLIEQGADINCNNHKLLKNAMIKKDFHTMEFLLECNIDISFLETIGVNEVPHDVKKWVYKWNEMKQLSNALESQLSDQDKKDIIRKKI